MNIDRNVRQSGDVRQKIKFCLDYLEKEGFSKGIDWNTQITDRLTLEEVIEAQQFKLLLIEKCNLEVTPNTIDITTAEQELREVA